MSAELINKLRKIALACSDHTTTDSLDKIIAKAERAGRPERPAMIDHLHNNCEGVDASVFSSDMMFDAERRNALKRYVERWARAITEHEAADATDAALAQTQAPSVPADERAAFEAWAEREGYSTAKVPGGVCMAGHPVYETPSTHSAWWAWQARATAPVGLDANAAVPGWQLVPVEPTEAMHAAAVKTIVRCTGNDDFPPRVWRAMLAAAPQPMPAAPEPAGERVAFEAWAARNGFYILRDESDKYRDYHRATTRWAWDAWQARSAAAPVGLDAGVAAPGARWTHTLKTDPEVFDAVQSGAKTHEIRKNDRGFAVGDLLVLKRTEATGEEMRAGAPLVYSPVPALYRTVTHVLTGYGLSEGWCILSLASAPQAQAAPTGEQPA